MTRAPALLPLTLALLLTACTGQIEETTYKMPDLPDASTSDQGEAPDQGQVTRDQDAIEDQTSAPDQEVQDQGGSDTPDSDLADMPGSPLDMVDEGVDMAAEPDLPQLPMYGSAGCLGGAGVSEGENLFMLNGRERKFVMRLPRNYDPSRPWPLVFALHGNGGDTTYWDKTSGERNVRQVLQDDAVLIVAQAIDKQWRDYNMPSDTWPERIEEELAYFDHLIDLSKRELCINEEAIFSIGFSGGGSFSGVLGCRREEIRAIAVGGSVIYFDQADCINTPAAWITIGTQELEMPRERFRDFFRERAGCVADTAPTMPDPCVAYKKCDVATPVHYCQHPAGHVWPAFGTQAMWDFFKTFVPATP